MNIHAPDTELLRENPAPLIEHPWERTATQVLTHVGSDPSLGLDSAEAERRFRRSGSNQLDAAPEISPWRRFVRQLSDPLVLLLLVAVVISLGAWVLEGATTFPFDSVVIIAIIVANAIIGLWQEGQARHAVAELRRMTQSHSTVVRSGRTMSIPSSDLVVGDILVLSEGDAVGADARLVELAACSAAEAALTGESLPVRKQLDPVASSTLAERTNMVFKGTAIVSGRGRAVVTATGMATEIGGIATMLSESEPPPTPLQVEIARLSRVLGVTVVTISILVVGAIIATSEITTVDDAVDALLVGVALAVAAVPEGLPAILSVVLAIGVQRMAGRKAIVKQLSAAQSLGSATVICSDKTGTLTRNEMTITRVVTATGAVDVTGTGYLPDGSIEEDGMPILLASELGQEVAMVLGAGSLANDAALTQRTDGTWEVLGDPTEGAFLVAARKFGHADYFADRFERMDELPFTSERKMMSTLEQNLNDPGPNPLVLITKGAPEVVLAACTHERRGEVDTAITDERRKQLDLAVNDLTEQAFRTLAVAYRPGLAGDTRLGASHERHLVLLGLAAMIDPARPEVRDAIAEADRAGIRVVAITGDHPNTAAKIAQDLGLLGPGRISVTGAELDAMDDTELDHRLQRASVFSRVAPEHKLRIVRALQRQSHVVAMTGDGVNDAPALRAADIGVAMGITGSEVSKEAADLILADDNFATIVTGVREGRSILINIEKFLRFLISTNAGEVLVMLVAIILASPLGLADVDAYLAVPLLASQILWINLLTDTGLALALGVDPPIDDVMGQRPRRAQDRLVDRRMLATVLLTGLTMTAACLIAFDLELAGGMLGGTGGLDSARTHVFTTLVLCSIFAAFSSRSATTTVFRRLFSNRLLWASAGTAVGLQVAAVHVPLLNTAFHTVAMSPLDWLRSAALASLVLWVEELRKWLWRSRLPSSADDVGL